MGVKEDDLIKKVVEYVKERFPEWLVEAVNSVGGGLNLPIVMRSNVYDVELRERMVRVEEELKNQRELIRQGFELMEKRFEQIDKRFEEVDKRFEQVDKRFEVINERVSELSKRMFQFMIWSFGFTATIAGVAIVVLKFS